MKEFRFKIFIIVAAVALSIFLLYPTYQNYEDEKFIQETISSVRDSIKAANPGIDEEYLNEIISIKEDSLRLSDPSFREAADKRVKLGLDLQGGMYLVMEVNTAKLLERIAREPDEEFLQLLAEAEEESRVSEENVVSILANKLSAAGISLSRYFGSIRQDEAEIIDNLEEQEADAVTRAIEIISNRVNQYGVSEPSIQQQGSRRIVVELPGIAREEEAKRLLQGRALLEFKLVKDPQFTFPVMVKVDEVLANLFSGDSTSSTDSLAADSLSQEQQEENFKKDHPFFYYAQVNQQSGVADAFVRENNMAMVKNFLRRPEVQKVVPDNCEFVFAANPIDSQDPVKYFKLYCLTKKPELTGGVIVDAQANIDQTTTAPIVTMQMNAEGARDWARITGSNVKKRCAIVLDGLVYTAPVINGKIPNGNSQIEGMKDLDEAKLLEIVLKAGALPAPVDIIEERTVGPSLGQDSINQGLNSTMIGFFLVAIFMIVYYRKAGGVADFALLFTIIFIMGILAGFQATLTLPGIAGIILTIGMAVDANVLIFERIREELSTGKTVKAAIEGGYAHSYSAIFDSNITTFFTAIILYQFGSGPIQGFALTLMIGILSSLFGALIITRVLFDVMASKGYKINVG